MSKKCPTQKKEKDILLIILISKLKTLPTPHGGILIFIVTLFIFEDREDVVTKLINTTLTNNKNIGLQREEAELLSMVLSLFGETKYTELKKIISKVKPLEKAESPFTEIDWFEKLFAITNMPPTDEGTSKRRLVGMLKPQKEYSLPPTGFNKEGLKRPVQKVQHINTHKQF
ncbi:hypothetical protein OOZ15_18375 [Galbibacter sp. EGI 63066]|uniref:hypothetical protein n=1 Tax=Galbibacter sp. EGI 63066 TaxID=2993559 RepID=UPI0022492741|nr:hypothetical protein [Galbibacter sp. EGI 63066]MCX2681924.1 hypothetical protein [Galbibacter sp. EGI 63066]